mmetsp:Transcript_7888/g.22356  ORF Transcript_7888/g.22356 Transcript_7888/m.22356 type:complete len:660 (-) Transcript_7888:484-2463(-)
MRARKALTGVVEVLLRGVMILVAWALVDLVVGAAAAAAASGDLFSEHVLVQFLSDSKLLAHFDFRLTGSIQKDGLYDIFPKSIGRIFTHIPTAGFTASLTQGRWKHHQWGDPPVEVTPPGGLLVANMEKAHLHRGWRHLVHALGGLLCATFGAVEDVSRHTTPLPHGWPLPSAAVMGAHTRTQMPGSSGSDTHEVRYASMPIEPLCTENLTPWLKLLPCRGQSGLASLLDPLLLAESPFKSLAIHAAEVPSPNPTSPHHVELALTLTAVLGYEQLAQGRQTSGRMSVESLLRPGGPRRMEACPPALGSWVHMRLPPDHSLLGTDLPATYTHSRLSDATHLGTWRAEEFRLPAALLQSAPIVRLGNERRDAWVDRQQIGSLLTKRPERLQGSMVVHLHNSAPSTIKHVVYQDTLPFYLNPLVHTLTSQLDIFDKRGQMVSVSHGADKSFSTLGIDWRFTDGRSAPSVFSFNTTLPASSILTISFELGKRFLHIGQFGFSPDKGQDVGSALFMQKPLSHFTWPPASVDLYDLDMPAANRSGPPSSADDRWLGHFTEGMVIMVPLPDFSMPFNVIALSSTVLTLFFGAVFRMTAIKPRSADDETKDRDEGDRSALSGKMSKIAALRLWVRRVMRCERGRGATNGVPDAATRTSTAEATSKAD